MPFSARGMCAAQAADLALPEPRLVTGRLFKGGLKLQDAVGFNEGERGLRHVAGTVRGTRSHGVIE